MTEGNRPKRSAAFAELAAWDDQYVWHPFTPHSVYRSEDPLMIVAGDGNYLIDADGRRYLDGVASLWCNVFGHRVPRIDAAIAAQLGRIAHATFLGNATAPAVALAKRLVDVSGHGLSRVFFSDDGSTAVEVALKIAYQFWQQRDGDDASAAKKRTRFATLAHAYHGDTVGAVSLGGIDLFHARYGGLLFDTLRAPAPYCYRCPYGQVRATCAEQCTRAFVELIDAHGPELAAVVLEPRVQGAAGMITQPPGFLRAVADAAARAGTLLILDEVAVGFGRSGETLFAFQQAGIRPDLLCLAKGLTGGYLPLAATLATEQIFAGFLGPPAQGRTFFHGHTYTGNPLGAAAALATLDIFEDDAVLATLPAKVDHLRHVLQRLAPLPAVGDIRQFGLAVGIELVADRATKTPFAAVDRRGMRVCRAAREHGVFLRPLGDVIVLMPPLSITEAEIDVLVDAVAHGIRTACGDAT